MDLPVNVVQRGCRARNEDEQNPENAEGFDGRRVRDERASGERMFF